MASHALHKRACLAHSAACSRFFIKPLTHIATTQWNRCLTSTPSPLPPYYSPRSVVLTYVVIAYGRCNWVYSTGPIALYTIICVVYFYRNESVNV